MWKCTLRLTLAKSLHDDDGPASRVHEVGRTGLVTQKLQDRPHRHCGHRAAEIMVPGELVAQAIRQRQHPLPHRHVGEHMFDQVRGALGHPASTTAPTHVLRLQENGSNRSVPHPVQRRRAKPPAN